MHRLTLPAAAYRHVVFTDARHRAALDLGRARAPSPARARGGASGDDEEEWFVRWVLRQGGVDYRHYRPETLKRRTAACLRALRAGSAGQARAVLQREPRLLPAALGALLIGVTGFFRDGPVFAALRDQLLPALAATGRALRVWSAGCSDGAELYSAAMLLDGLGALDRCDLLGTDCRADAVARAAAGTYCTQSLDAVPPDLRLRHFERDGDGWRVHPRLRAAASWRRANVLDEDGTTSGAERWDLILCRNLAIYLRPETVGRLWERLTGRLRPGGLLVVGKGERPAALAEVAPCVYRVHDTAGIRFVGAAARSLP